MFGVDLRVWMNRSLVLVNDCLWEDLTALTCKLKRALFNTVCKATKRPYLPYGTTLNASVFFL